MRISVTLLQYEHGILRQVLDVLAEVIKSQKTEEKSKDIRELLHFLYEYVDRFHHNKEEQLFFPVVRQQFPAFNKEVDNIFDEHRQARKLFEEAIEALDVRDWERLDKSGMELVKHMIAHVEKEENHIFPTIDENLSIDIDESLNQSYAHYLSMFGPDYYQKAELFANEIQDRLLGPGFFHQGIY